MVEAAPNLSRNYTLAEEDAALIIARLVGLRDNTQTRLLKGALGMHCFVLKVQYVRLRGLYFQNISNMEYNMHN